MRYCDWSSLDSCICSDGISNRALCGCQGRGCGQAFRVPVDRTALSQRDQRAAGISADVMGNTGIEGTTNHTHRSAEQKAAQNASPWLYGIAGNFTIKRPNQRKMLQRIDDAEEIRKRHPLIAEQLGALRH